MQTGVVKWFNDTKGFGFIAPDVGGDDVFVHRSNLAGGLQTLMEGHQVQYTPGPGRKGIEARDVEVI